MLVTVPNLIPHPVTLSQQGATFLGIVQTLFHKQSAYVMIVEYSGKGVAEGKEDCS